MEIVKKTELVRDSIGISTYESDDKDTAIICAKAADELLSIGNIVASFVIGKVDENVSISGRSIGDINVQVILEKMGGGGHSTVAGAQIEGKSIEEVKQELLAKIDEYFVDMEA
jgi:c-di-AMP phosphodiesterase-like protein